MSDEYIGERGTDVYLKDGGKEELEVLLIQVLSRRGQNWIETEAKFSPGMTSSTYVTVSKGVRASEACPRTHVIAEGPDRANAPIATCYLQVHKFASLTIY